MGDTVLIKLIKCVVGVKMDKCCKDYYCSFPAWIGSNCIFCGAKCDGCEVKKYLIRATHKIGGKKNGR